MAAARRRLALLTVLAGLAAASAMAACGGQLQTEITAPFDSGGADVSGGGASDATVPEAASDGDTALDATATDAETSDDSGANEASSGNDSGTAIDAEPDVAAEAGVDASSDAGAEADASPVGCPPAVHSGSAAVAYQVDPQHTGAQPGDFLTLPLCQRWSHDFGGFMSTPVIANGLVFAVATPVSGQPAVFALDENTGAVVWGPKNLGGPHVSGNLGGVALDGGALFAVSGDGVLAAFDPATGTTSWQTTLTGQLFWDSSPVAVGGVVAVSGSANGATIYGVRESDGALLWTHTANGDDSSPAMTGNALFFHDDCGAVYRLDTGTGGLVWTHPGTCIGGGYHSISILGGKLYVGDLMPGGIVVDASTGAQVGTFDSWNTPAASGGVGYFVSSPSRVLSAIRLGSSAPLWSSGSQLVTPPLVVGSDVVVGSPSGLYVFSTVHGSLVSSAPVAVRTGVSNGTPGLQEADGVLFVASGTSLLAY